MLDKDIQILLGDAPSYKVYYRDNFNIYVTMHNKDELLAKLHANSKIITPNNRLSKQLLDDYCHRYLHASTKSLTKPSCLPYPSFLIDTYTQIQHAYPNTEHPVLLSGFQERYLWQQILKAEPEIQTNANLVNQVQEAFNRCQIWQVAVESLEFLQTSQCQLFQKLFNKMQAKLVSLNAICQAQLGNYILNFPLPSTANIIFACFDDYTPQQNLLQEYLIKNGNSITHFDLNIQQAIPTKYPATDSESEYLAMLAWLKSRLAADASNIAIVVPNIAEIGSTIQRLIQKHLPSESINISLGENLNKFLLVAHALNWINLDTEPLSNHKARLILNSPYIAGSASEHKQRTALYQNSRIFAQNSIVFSDFIRECQRLAPKLAQTLKGLSKYPATASISSWVKIFKNRLFEIGFPGEYSLSSAGYQCLQRLEDIFVEFRRLSLFTNKVDKSTAIATFSELLERSIFQPQQAASKITILGLLEASGCSFDSIWVCNLHDKSLPGKTKFSAFIPIELQKKLLMPHSSNQRELQLAKQQIHRLTSSCKHIVFSYPSFVDDIPMLPSPLIVNFQNLEGIKPIKLEAKQQLVTYSEEYIYPILDLNPIRGGTSIVANQAQCPFKAFAKHRLLALGENDIQDWPNNLERGQILHKILEEFYTQVTSKQELLKLSTNETDNLIERTINKVINRDTVLNNLALTNLIKQGELQRLTRQIKSAITWELARPEFTIAATEKEYNIAIEGLSFNVRVDRVDKLQNHNQVCVIDYKSRMPSTKPWLEDRPLEPQLLIYALLEASISSIAFLELRAGQITASGISKKQLEINGIKPINDWEEEKTKWHTQVASLVNEFKAGECQPSPAKATICKTCGFQDLCRIE